MMNTDFKVLAVLLRIEKLLDASLLNVGEETCVQLSLDDSADGLKPPMAGDAVEIGYPDDELVTTKYAMAELKVSRWKIEDMRDKKELTTVKKHGQVRLVKREVEAAKIWYSGPKGKL